MLFLDDVFSIFKDLFFGLFDTRDKITMRLSKLCCKRFDFLPRFPEYLPIYQTFLVFIYFAVFVTLLAFLKIVTTMCCWCLVSWRLLRPVRGRAGAKKMQSQRRLTVEDGG
jgi:hypothetical protein